MPEANAASELRLLLTQPLLILPDKDTRSWISLFLRDYGAGRFELRSEMPRREEGITPPTTFLEYPERDDWRVAHRGSAGEAIQTPPA